MILTYGSYAHADKEANVTISRSGLEAEDGYIYGYREVWNITGILQSENDADLVQKMATLVAAYRIQGQDLLWTKGGAVIHQLLSSQTLAGTKVTKVPEFPRSGNGEMTAFRTYAISVEADILFNAINAEDPQILKFEETVVTSGTGGAKFAYLPTLTGYHQRQILTETTPVTITQSGIAVGLGAYPTPSLPLWPLYEHLERRQITQVAKRKRNGTDVEFPIHWQYTFERNQPFPAAS